MEIIMENGESDIKGDSNALWKCSAYLRFFGFIDS